MIPIHDLLSRIKWDMENLCISLPASILKFDAFPLLLKKLTL